MKFPVSARTPMIQSLVEWDHSVKWPVVSFHGKVNRKKNKKNKVHCKHYNAFLMFILQSASNAGEITLNVDISSSEYSFLKTTKIDDLPILPYAGYLVSFYIVKCFKIHICIYLLYL